MDFFNEARDDEIVAAVLQRQRITWREKLMEGKIKIMLVGEAICQVVDTKPVTREELATLVETTERELESCRQALAEYDRLAKELAPEQPAPQADPTPVASETPVAPTQPTAEPGISPAAPTVDAGEVTPPPLHLQ